MGRKTRPDLQCLCSGPEVLFLSLQCTGLAALDAQETQALPPPSSIRPVVSVTRTTQFSAGSSICGHPGSGYGTQVRPNGSHYPSSTDESVLMDLKALLLEAKQKVPPVLQVLHCGDESMLDIGGEC
jgi:hypothetical protein